MTRALKIPTAKVFEPMLKPSRHKALYGGRGGMKSTFFAGLLVEECLLTKGTRAVCLREVQKSLRESSKLLIEDTLRKYELGEADGFKVYDEVIRTPGDGLITFNGLADKTAESIKSLEGFSRAWVEEAQTISPRSIKLLTPTIRVPGSELWWSWNPRHKTDAVDVMFRGPQIPENAIVLKVGWQDNPWFPPELEQERRDCMRMTPEDYDHIWNGAYTTVASGAYFAKHLNEARTEGRIGKVARDPLARLRAFCDIGGTGAKADAFAIWIVQFVGREVRFLDYYEARGQSIDHHLNWLRSRGYGEKYCDIYLPHDGQQNDKVFAVSYESAFRGQGYSVTVVPNMGQGAAIRRIEALRLLFPQCWFNEATCEGGLDALGWYHELKDEKRNMGLGPDHDWSSHGSDAAGMVAICYRAPSNNLNPNKTDWSKPISRETAVA